MQPGYDLSFGWNSFLDLKNMISYLIVFRDIIEMEGLMLGRIDAGEDHRFVAREGAALQS